MPRPRTPTIATRNFSVEFTLDFGSGFCSARVAVLASRAEAEASRADSLRKSRRVSGRILRVSRESESRAGRYESHCAGRGGGGQRSTRADSEVVSCRRFDGKGHKI